MIDHQDLCVLYHSGELGQADGLAFEGHLAGCPSCAALLEALRAGSRAAALAALAVPRRARASAPRPRPSARPLAAAGAVLALLAGAVFWSPGRGADGLAWRNGLDHEIVRVNRELDSLSESILRTGAEVEIDDDLRRLDDAARILAREVAGGRVL